MKLKIIIALLLISLSSLCSQVLVSEIYGNSVGRVRDAGREWIELQNLGEEIIVERIDFAIYRTKNHEATFKKNISLPKSVRFSRFLLIAQEKNLSLPHCFNETIPIIVIPGFRIVQDSDYTYCVTINDTEKTCVVLPKNVKMLDGTSLYRDVNDQREIPFWRHEPCQLADKIFASPAMAERFCARSDQKPFERCDAVNNLFVRKITSNSTSRTKLIPSEIEIENANDNITLSLNVDDNHDFFLARLCARHKGSEKICHLVDQESIVENSNNLTIAFSTKQLNQNMGEDLFINIESLDEKAAMIDVSLHEIVIKKPRDPPEIVAQDLLNQRIMLMFSLIPADLPLNVMVLTKNSTTLMQRAFVEAGEKTMTFFITYPFNEVTISLVGETDSYSCVFKEKGYEADCMRVGSVDPNASSL